MIQIKKDTAVFEFLLGIPRNNKMMIDKTDLYEFKDILKGILETMLNIHMKQ